MKTNKFNQQSSGGNKTTSPFPCRLYKLKDIATDIDIARQKYFNTFFVKDWQILVIVERKCNILFVARKVSFISEVQVKE